MVKITPLNLPGDNENKGAGRHSLISLYGKLSFFFLNLEIFSEFTDTNPMDKYFF